MSAYGLVSLGLGRIIPNPRLAVKATARAEAKPHWAFSCSFFQNGNSSSTKSTAGKP